MGRSGFGCLRGGIGLADRLDKAAGRAVRKRLSARGRGVSNSEMELLMAVFRRWMAEGRVPDGAVVALNAVDALLGHPKG